ncbi:MAG: hypothetical protein IRY95_03115, partial [Clostridia bacterium]|nr:hypothetical protein [Clostridia bacterium]
MPLRVYMGQQPLLELGGESVAPFLAFCRATAQSFSWNPATSVLYIHTPLTGRIIGVGRRRAPLPGPGDPPDDILIRLITRLEAAGARVTENVDPGEPPVLWLWLEYRPAVADVVLRYPWRPLAPSRRLAGELIQAFRQVGLPARQPRLALRRLPFSAGGHRPPGVLVTLGDQVLRLERALHPEGALVTALFHGLFRFFQRSDASLFPISWWPAPPETDEPAEPAEPLHVPAAKTAVTSVEGLPTAAPPALTGDDAAPLTGTSGTATGVETLGGPAARDAAGEQVDNGGQVNDGGPEDGDPEADGDASDDCTTDTPAEPPAGGDDAGLCRPSDELGRSAGPEEPPSASAFPGERVGSDPLQPVDAVDVAVVQPPPPRPFEPARRRPSPSYD